MRHFYELEALVSCKVASDEARTEGSRTTKVGPNEEELDTEANVIG